MMMTLRQVLMIAAMIGACAWAGPLRAQEHKSIHEIESERHHWDALRLDPRVPEFAQGKASAIGGDYSRAIAQFRRGAKKNRAASEFNIGLVYFYQSRYTEALRRFRASSRLRPDSVTTEYLQTSRRLLTERSKQRMK